MADQSVQRGYAIYLNEGPGYLLVRFLASGTYGKAMLVRSCVPPHSLYVRKRVMWQENTTGADGIPGEVYNYPEQTNIPKLIDWTVFDEESYAMTTQFCNGDTLDNMIYQNRSIASKPIMELYIWKMLIQLLSVLKHIHCEASNPIVHLDIAPRNIFLHWPSTSSAGNARPQALPDFFLGDFGVAEPLRMEKVAASLDYDMMCLQETILQVCCCKTKMDSFSPWKDFFPREYSAELRECVSLIFKRRTGQRPMTFPADQLCAMIIPRARPRMLYLARHFSSADLPRVVRDRAPNSVKITTRKEDLSQVWPGTEAFDTAHVTVSGDDEFPIINHVEEDPTTEQPIRVGTGVRQ